MISTVIDEINKGLTKLFEKYTGTKVYGQAQSMLRTVGTETELLPALVDHTGEGTYVGIDDTAPIIVYHKVNSITTALVVGSGYGDALGSWRNTYANALIVYLNRKRANILPEDLHLYIQENFPDAFKINEASIAIRFTNVILNSTQVWAAEYQNTGFKLSPEANLFAINYTVESTFKKGCFEKCL